MRTGASSSGRISAIHFSCLGTPIPTHTTSAREALISPHHGVALLIGEGPVRGRVAADDLHAGVALAQVQGELDERALVAAAVQVQALAGVGAARTRACHQLRTVDPGLEGVPERAHRPHQGLAVGNVDRGVQQRLAQGGIFLGRHHGMDVADADVAALPLGGRRVDPVQRVLVVGEGERHPEHIDGSRGLDLDRIWIEYVSPQGAWILLMSIVQAAAEGSSRVIGCCCQCRWRLGSRARN